MRSSVASRPIQVGFWTPGHSPAKDANCFGCSSYGLAAEGLWAEPGGAAFAAWGLPLDGATFSGEYASVAAVLKSLAFSPSLLLVLTAIGTGVEEFLASIRGSFPDVPIAGGSAARTEGVGELLPPASQVSVLAVNSGKYTAECHNLLDPLADLEFAAEGPRTLKAIEVEPGLGLRAAIAAFAELQRRNGKAESDFESITLSDDAGRNMHFHVENGKLVSGADLPAAGKLHLRAADPATLACRLDAILSDPGTLLLGCAGLRAALPRPIEPAPGSVSAFLYGEIGPFDGRPAFGNLTAVSVRAQPECMTLSPNAA